MNKKTLIFIVAGAAVLMLLGLGIYFKISKPETENKAPEKAASPTEKLIESASKGTLPSLETNPLENKPDLNPVDTANPFKNIKTNPFD